MKVQFTMFTLASD